MFNAPISAPDPRDCSPLPCFYWTLCRQRAELEKCGRSVCQGCADRLRGIIYPLRLPTRDSLYPNGRAMAEALDMVEPDRPGRRSSRRRRDGRGV